MLNAVLEVLDEAAARDRLTDHHTRVDAWIGPHLARRGVGSAHPVEDFLFSYYSYRPASLRRWHPGIGVGLRGESVELPRGYVADDGLSFVDPALMEERAERTRWIRGLLAAVDARPPMLGCFGLHEWAMVYRQSASQLRHAAYPLRLTADETNDVVETHRITCTHFDAFRFFTDEARPLNVIEPSRETQAANDQPGCLHATMDVYKWAYKLAPFTSAELVADCFELAREVRLVDMRAAPYDLSSLGVTPIAIETPAGKAEYLAAQRAFADRAHPLRRRLIDVCDRVLRPVEWSSVAP